MADSFFMLFKLFLMMLKYFLISIWFDIFTVKNYQLKKYKEAKTFMKKSLNLK